MKRQNNLNIAKLTFISILLIALGSGCFFAGKNWDSWFPEIMDVPEDPKTPTHQPEPVGENGVVTPDTEEQCTDLNYNGKKYRVEKSLLTEAGSKYNASKRFYRHLNGKWEMKEELADAKWKPATPSSDIPLILAEWDEKFRAEEAQTVIEQSIEDPKKDHTKKDNTKKDDAKKGSFETSYNEIKAKVKNGKCDEKCIQSYQTLTTVQKNHLLKMLPK